MDFSTINLALLKKLPRYTLLAGHTLQKSSGNGCFLDAPGYPTYFTRSVYDRHGNNPYSGAQMVIEFEGVLYVVQGEEDSHEKMQALLRRLWIQLPVDHPRVQLWREAVYQHMANCYTDEQQIAEPFEYGRSAIVIWPIPNYKLRQFHDDERFSEEWRAKEKASVEQENAERHAKYAKVCIPENHIAVRSIREFYPEHQPDEALIANPPKSVPPQWYETLAEQPTAETCKPRGMIHPINKTWCQWCGWHESPNQEAVQS